MGVLGGVTVAFGLVIFVNYLDDTIRSQDDVEVFLKLPFLGYVSNIKSNSILERDLQSHLHPQSNAAEGFRPSVQLFRCLKAGIDFGSFQ